MPRAPPAAGPAQDLAEHRGHDHATGENLMPGMLTSAQLEELERARGRRFDGLFLRHMSFHHAGALEMVRRLRSEDGGMEPELDAFARHVEADQQIEISRMRELAAALE